LAKLLKDHPRLLYVDHVEATGLAMFACAIVLELEGVVAKDIKSPYVEGPVVTWHWQKIKNRNYKRQGKREFAPPRR
jgi:ATP-dependent DNA ligase